jgi:hypothetical protein
VIRAMNNTLLCKPRPDIHKLVCEFVSSGEEIDSAIFGKVRIDNTISYDVTSRPNQFAFGEVHSMGRGAVWMPERLLPHCPVGSIIGFDLAQVSHAFPHEGETLYDLPIDAALCRFDVGARLPTPLGAYMLTEEDPASLKRLTMRDNKTKLILPDTTLAQGLKTNDRTWSRVTIAAEKVLDVGTGGMAVVEKPIDKFVGFGLNRNPIREKERIEVHPDRSAIGFVALFMPTMSVDLYAYGTRHRFTPWDRLRSLVQWDTGDTRKEREAAA